MQKNGATQTLTLRSTQELPRPRNERAGGVWLSHARPRGFPGGNTHASAPWCVDAAQHKVHCAERARAYRAVARAQRGSMSAMTTAAGVHGPMYARARALRALPRFEAAATSLDDAPATGLAKRCGAAFPANSKRSRPAHTLRYCGTLFAADGAGACGRESPQTD